MNEKQFVGQWKSAQESGLEDGFLKECKKICNDDFEFKEFKRNPTFIKIIGNDVREKYIADIYYNFIKDTDLMQLIRRFKTNDILGYPGQYFYPKTGPISPGTLCFLAILHDINTRLLNIKGKTICEIGAGYGGQSKIFLDYKAKSVTLMDRCEVIALSKKYLSHFKYKRVQYYTTDSIPEEEYDLVVSNWCLSELDRLGTKFYLDNVISKSQYGYFLINYRNDDDQAWLISELKNIYSDVRIEEENPRTNENVNYAILCSK